MVAAMTNASSSTFKLLCNRTPGLAMTEVSASRPMTASAMARIATCIATPPSTLFTASDALPPAAAVTVTATSGSDVMAPSSSSPTTARPMPVFAAMASA